MSLAEPVWNQKKSMLSFLEPVLQNLRIRGTINTKTDTTTSVLRGEQLYGNESINRDMLRLCKQGRLKEALRILHVMDHRGMLADDSAYASLLQGCVERKALPEGKLVHAHMIETAFKPDNFLETKLLIMYAKSGCMVVARRLLDEMPKQNVFAWTAMIAAHASRGYSEEALTLYYEMQRTGIQPNQFTFSSVLPAFGSLGDLEQGKEVHEDIIRSGYQSDNFVGNALVDMYVKCGDVENARQVFDKMSERDVISWNAIIAGYAQDGPVEEAQKLFQKMPERNVVSWTAMITAYSRHGYDEEALSFFYQMQHTGVQPDQFTFASVLPACANLAALERGKEVHESIIRNGFQSDVFVGSALVDMYVKCGGLENARTVFDKMSERDVVSWNAMISGYAQGGHVDEALKLFQNMPEQNLASWNAMIAGFAQNGHLEEALKLFEKVPEQHVISWNAMITGYAQNGHVDKALELFHNVPEQNVVSWNAMIAGYVQNGYFNEAIELFRQMQVLCVKSNSVTFASVLPASANLAALDHGRGVHAYIIRSGFDPDIFVGNALVDMYAKCGSIEDARHVFDTMTRRNVVSWTTMIVGYAMHGYGKESLQVFEQMQLSSSKPNHITFLGVLSACCHAGLVDDGWQYFNRMSRDFNITPAVEHYCCMVDLLGRAGHLNEAQDFINKMPIEPEAAVWGCLLGACRTHTNIELGEQVAERLFDMDPQNAAHYVLLSNIYAASGRWDDVEKVRRMMKENRIKKMPGSSWIEVNNKLYTFLVGDRSHPQTEEIYAMLERLSGQMKEAGYVSNTNFVLHDVEKEQKEHIICHHSEKLAIAFGLINMSPGTPIRIAKNLRVCGDCHSAIKFISKIVAREIVVRDANRFHHFKDGQCSCGDYW
eukprot:Gb_34253 [translate_table: standard]